MAFLWATGALNEHFSVFFEDSAHSLQSECGLGFVYGPKKLRKARLVS